MLVDAGQAASDHLLRLEVHLLAERLHLEKLADFRREDRELRWQLEVLERRNRHRNDAHYNRVGSALTKYVDSEACQIGNAVPVQLSEVIATDIRRRLEAVKCHGSVQYHGSCQYHGSHARGNKLQPVVVKVL